MSPPVATATLLDALPDKTVLGAPPATVTGIAYDSRTVAPGGHQANRVARRNSRDCRIRS